ncbi:thermonuclease family protein [Pseudoxanthomonas winnipegensis]|uniref:Thermonuclease family protein n=1 Tax=Pseudoxanthomonas winnipegensis TaxID=2480810 RepID=A0A4V2HFX1_9GAMM|nr:thermonuclease family protein [Pseudoxanthomonas winnipegensis]TAA41486.1 thermonuclease family protein [Pseudoxanthomonas winnipegensis]
MSQKVTIHSNGKRFVQVVGTAVLLVAILTGLKKASIWWKGEGQVARVEEASPSTPQEEQTPGLIVGRSSVFDGDTIEIHGERVRLFGVDAPESGQRCSRSGQEWPCGQRAALALSDWLGSRTVSCNPTGKDRYQRTLARCFAGTEDVQAWLVLNGWALAYRQYSTDYVSAEEVAQARRAGVWAGEFTKPWEWRKGVRQQ